MFKKSNIPGDVTPKPAPKAETVATAAAPSEPATKEAAEPKAAEPAKDAKKA